MITAIFGIAIKELKHEGLQMDPAHKGYFHFTRKSWLDKSINTLLGIIEGISIDSKINEREVTFLQEWVDGHEDVLRYQPFNELVAVIDI